MSFIDDLWGGISNLWHAVPGGAQALGDSFERGGEYKGIDRSNFDLPGFAGIQDRYNGYLGNIDSRGDSSFRGGQEQLAAMLMDRARGRGPSVAGETLRQQNELAQRQQLSMAAGANPSNSALAQRLASENMANQAVGLGGAAALARAAEANQAAGLLGNVYGQGRQQDITAQAANDAARAELLRQGLAAAGLQQQGGMNYEQNRTARYGASMGQPTTSERILGGVLGGLKGGF